MAVMIKEDHRSENPTDPAEPEHDEAGAVRQQARLTLAGQARDAEELKMLLEMLGLHPSQEGELSPCAGGPGRRPGPARVRVHLRTASEAYRCGARISAPGAP